jgi:hypothetical protein
MAKESLPPGAERVDGVLVRRVEMSSMGGGTWEKLRPVALTLEEARAKKQDYYHPELGWIREGWKLEKDRDTTSIMEDGSSAMPMPEKEMFPSAE